MNDLRVVLSRTVNFQPDPWTRQNPPVASSSFITGGIIRNGLVPCPSSLYFTCIRPFLLFVLFLCYIHLLMFQMFNFLFFFQDIGLKGWFKSSYLLIYTTSAVVLLLIFTWWGLSKGANRCFPLSVWWYTDNGAVPSPSVMYRLLQSCLIQMYILVTQYWNSWKLKIADIVLK